MHAQQTWRKATVLADSVVAICGEGDDFTGHMLIDDEYLRAKGLQAEDFIQYRCDPETEPERLLADGNTEGEWLASAPPQPRFGGGGGGGERHAVIKRGDVKSLDKDIETTGGDGAFRKAKL